MEARQLEAYQSRLDAADRAIEAGRNQRADPREIARRSEAMQTQQLREYQSRLDAADRAIQAGRSQQVDPREVARQTERMQAQQLDRYRQTLDARDAALAQKPRPRPIGLPPGISPRPTAPNGINQPVNQLPRPTTPTLAPRPSNVPQPARIPLPSSSPTAGTNNPSLGNNMVPLNPLSIFPGALGALQLTGSLALTPIGIFNPDVGRYAEDLGKEGSRNADVAIDMALGPLSAKNPYNPLNPFGKWWDWAPWNQGKSPNSLNPDNQIKPGFDKDEFFPIQPQLSSAVSFRATCEATGTRWLNNYVVSTFPFTGAANGFGIPLGFKIRAYLGSPKLKTMVFLYVNGQGQQAELDIISVYDPSGKPTPVPTGDVLSNLSPNVSSPQANLSPKPSLSDEPIAGDELYQIPPEQLAPDAPPQYEPTGRPEAQTRPTPAPSPKPLVEQVPRPSPAPQPQRRPQPTRDPASQPNPIPKPEFDPQEPPSPDLNPGESPFPWFDPDPFRNPFSPFNPVNSPANNPNQTPSRTTVTELRPSPRPEFPGIKPGFGKSYESFQVPDQLTDQYPQPQPQPQTKPAPEADMCKDPCIADMHDTSKGQKPKNISYKVFQKCGDNGPEFETKTMSVPVNEADALKILLDDAADRKGEKCTTESNTLTIPEWWAVRPGADRPQFVILYAEVFSSGKLGNGRWQLTVPHYNRPKGAKPQIPKYQKGNWMGTLTLTDNSKIRINAASASECRRVINKLKILIPVTYRTQNGKAIKATILQREDGTLKEVNVIAIRGDYYATGQRSQAPDWSVNFRK